jgi:hypothetical protein
MEGIGQAEPFRLDKRSSSKPVKGQAGGSD